MIDRERDRELRDKGRALRAELEPEELAAAREDHAEKHDNDKGCSDVEEHVFFFNATPKARKPNG